MRKDYDPMIEFLKWVKQALKKKAKREAGWRKRDLGKK